LHTYVGSVNITVVPGSDTVMPTRERYHHGNLQAALVAAGVELAREGGPDAVVVREASRRVGVSHNAAYRHFPNRDAFLTAVCDRCMNRLAELMETLVAEVDPTDRSPAAAFARLRATGRAYIRFAVTEPGLFRTAFSVPVSMLYPSSGAQDEPPAMRPGPFTLLGMQLDGLVAAGGLTPQRRAGADFAAWSAVHGLSMLLIEGPLRELPDDVRAEITEQLLDTVQRGI